MLIYVLGSNVSVGYVDIWTKTRSIRTKTNKSVAG